MYDDILTKVKNIHFVGIGGSGMCPMAEILHAKGYNISGSDCYKSDTLERILDSGIKIFMQHDKENVNNVDLLVYSAAIKQDNPEILSAKEKGIPVIERCVMLGLLAKEYDKSVAIAGTHGKTTTTSMLTQILIDSKKDPSAIIGGRLNSINGNSCIGKSDIMVCEACEYVDSFLQIHPAIAVILNVDPDHMDYFKTFENMKKSFGKFAKQAKSMVIYNGDDKNCLECVKELEIKAVSFGLGEQNDYTAVNITKNSNFCQEFAVKCKGELLSTINLSVPGKHNVMNALAAFASAHLLAVNSKEISDSLKEFKGTHRRFEILSKVNDITVADDFAHHPTELRATLSCAMEMGFRKVWAVFQPHTFSRTATFLDEFAESLSIADNVIMSEILPVRETNTYNIYTEDLAKKIPNSVWFNTFEEISDYVASKVQPGDLVLTLGGGNVYRCADMIIKKLKEQ